MRLCVVMPMHNEEVVCEKSVRTVLPYLKGLPLAAELLVVNDGSADATASTLTALKKEGLDFHVVEHVVNKGYGAALRTASDWAYGRGFSHCLFMDSDLTNHPRFIPAFAEMINRGFDYIKGSRYCRGGGVDGVPAGRRLLSMCGNIAARALLRLPLSDCTNGFRAVKTEILSRMKLKEQGFAVIMEELYQARWLTGSFCEVPIILTSRQEGQGNTHFSFSSAAYWPYFKYCLMSFFGIKPF